MKNGQRTPAYMFFINLMALIVAYYLSILLHEWAHGTVAWLYGEKSSPFAVKYGGWFLMNADEQVDYSDLIQAGRGVAAALIGIAGSALSFFFLLASFIWLNKKSILRSPIKFTFVYWFLIINMIPMVQYLTVSTFSTEGDTGRFIHGLNISGWWIFVPGLCFISYALWRILTIEIIKAYAVMPVKTVLGRNLLLLLTLALIFWFIYSHGYNPLTDEGTNAPGKIYALISIALVPILFVLCNPLRTWVKKSGDNCFWQAGLDK